MKILIIVKVETVSLNRVKPAHLDNEPDIGTEKQRKTKNSMNNSKNTAIVRRAPALKQNCEKKRAEPKAKTQTRSVVVQNGTNLATISQHNANRVNLPKQFTPYVARIREPPPFPALTGAAAVCKRIHVYLYTYGIKPLIQMKRPNHRMLKTIRISPTTTKLYQTQPQNKPELD